MNLYLDDMRPVPKGWVLAGTVEQAKQILIAGDVDECSLDHDLGACGNCMKLYALHDAAEWLVRSKYQSMPHCSHVGTGVDLVEWMVDSQTWPKQKPTVHSANPVGAKIMRELIDKHFPGAKE